TGRHDVLPDRLSALVARNDVVVVELGHALALAAVLAAKAVTREYVEARELHATLDATDRLLETHDSRGPKRNGRRTDLLVVLLEPLDLVQEEERNGGLPRNHLVRHHPRREQQRLRGHDPPAYLCRFFISFSSPIFDLWCSERDSNPQTPGLS